MSRFFKNLAIVADVFLWVILLLVGYIFADLTGFLLLFYLFLGGTVIYGALMAAFWITVFLADRRADIALKEISRRGRQ